MALGSLVLDSITSSTGQVIGASSASTMKNRVINGDMRIDQRNSGNAINATSPSGNMYAVDRFFCEYKNAGNSATVQQVSDAPAGFQKSFKVTVNTGSAMGTNDYLDIQHYIEGYNVADFNFGTSNAKTVTLSFWVKSSITGTFCVGFFTPGVNQRSYRTTYTINSANTWEQKTITIPGDTGGTTWNTTNANGLSIVWAIAIGSYVATSTANSWVDGISWGTLTGCSTAHLSTSGSTFQLTGVQLEVGAVATTFDYRHFQQELALCQRYFWSPGNYDVMAYAESTTQVTFMGKHPVPMRTSPTVSASTFITLNQNYGGNPTQGSFAFNAQTTTFTLNGYAANFTGLTQGRIYNLYSPSLSISAEL